MASNVYRDTITFLKDKGIEAEFPTLKIYLGQEPDKQGAETMLTIIPQAGFDDDAGDGGVEYPGIQLLCRSRDFDLTVEILEWVKQTLTNTVTSDFIVYNPVNPIDETWATLPNTWDEWTIWGGEISTTWSELPDTWDEWTIWSEEIPTDNWTDLPDTWNEWLTWGEEAPPQQVGTWKDLPKTWSEWTKWSENAASSVWKDLPKTWSQWKSWNYSATQPPSFEAIRRDTRIFGWENTSTMGLVIKDKKERWVFSDNYIIYTNKK